MVENDRIGVCPEGSPRFLSRRELVGLGAGLMTVPALSSRLAAAVAA
jgi:hypothetical protein